MQSTALMNASWKAKAPISACYESFCDFYSEADITDLISYATARGVRLVPSTGLMPGVSEMVRILNTSMLPPVGPQAICHCLSQRVLSCV